MKVCKIRKIELPLIFKILNSLRNTVADKTCSILNEMKQTRMKYTELEKFEMKKVI